MPLKVRCPHCKDIVVAPDTRAGQRMLCPTCDRMFNLPLPRAVVEAAAQAVTASRTCPRCHAEVARHADLCRQCWTDLRTGQRLPLGQRLRHLPGRVWGLVAFGAVVVGLVTFAGLRYYAIHHRAVPAGTPQSAKGARSGPGGEAVAPLFAATTPVELNAALVALRGAEVRAAPAVAAGLRADLARGAGGRQAVENRLAAIELLARCGPARGETGAQWLAVLRQCAADSALGDAASRARALLGDADVLDELVSRWLELLDRALFLARLHEVTAAPAGAPLETCVARARQELARCGTGLQALAASEANPVFERLAEAYWGSWDWLGQETGSALGAELFALGRPRDASLQFDPNEVRRPSELLARVAQRGTASARAAAGLVLQERAPQATGELERIAALLGEQLPLASAVEQQRLTWALARLRGRRFGNISDRDPREVTAAEIAAAQHWLRPGETPVLREPYPEPPELVYRAVTVERQIEQELLGELARGWPALNGVLTRWRATRLGCTPRVRGLLRPGQRRPEGAALTAGMLIVAVAGDESARPQLELWREAREQERWVRALAYTTLASLDARVGRSGNWPAGLDVGDLAMLERGRPGWEHFGVVIAAGGPALRQRLAEAELPAGVKEKLVRAADDAARRTVPSEPP